ncbi:MAG: DUF167 domain-containing protein [Acidobacteriaceae bacterium]
MMSLDGLTIHPTEHGCIFSVKVHPGARRDAVTGIQGGSLKISLTAPPTDGRANARLIAFLADIFDIPRSRIQLLTGAGSRSKTLQVELAEPGRVLAALHATLAKHRP